MGELPENIPSILKPRLRLFMSADVVGSTKLKQPGFLENEFDWLPILQDFYGETVLAVQTEWLSLQSEFEDTATHTHFFGDPPQFWKTVGDEVLYYKDLSDSRQLAVTIACWKRALARVRAHLYKYNEGVLKEAKVELDVKATLWTAGFPWRNKTIVSPSGLLDELCKESDYDKVFENAHEQAHSDAPCSGDELKPRVEFDFIGPGIDIGFRLCGFSTIQKMVLSMDAAYILAGVRGSSLYIDPEEIYYDGRVPLKGVFGGKGYPLFWLDNSPPGSFEREESEARHAISDKAVTDFCKRFYKEHFAEFTHAPFIAEDHGGVSAVPDGFTRWLDVQIGRYEERRLAEERRQLAEQELAKPGAARAGGHRQAAEIDVDEVSKKLAGAMPKRPDDEAKQLDPKKVKRTPGLRRRQHPRKG